MSDLISRQAAIEVIDAVMPVDPNKSEYASGIACGAALAMTYVKQLPSAQPESQWISCSERLPEENGRYLISVLDGVGRRTTVAPYQPRYKAWTMTGKNGILEGYRMDAATRTISGRR